MAGNTYDPRRISGMPPLTTVNGNELLECAQQDENGEWTNKSITLEALLSAEGEKGDDGLNAYQLAYLQGFSGTLTEWLISLKGEPGVKGSTGQAGENGLSSYQLAVLDGFNGTVEQWLASLKGDKGDSGESILYGTNTVNEIAVVGEGITAQFENGKLTLGVGDLGSVNSRVLERLITTSNNGAQAKVMVSGFGALESINQVTISYEETTNVTRMILDVPQGFRVNTVSISHQPGFFNTGSFELAYPEPAGRVDPTNIPIPTLSLFNYTETSVMQPPTNVYFRFDVDNSLIVVGKSGLSTSGGYRWKFNLI